MNRNFLLTHYTLETATKPGRGKNRAIHCLSCAVYNVFLYHVYFASWNID